MPEAPPFSRSPFARYGLAWLPIPLFLVAIIALWVAEVRLVWTSPALHWLLHYGSAALGVVFIVIPAAGSFLANGQASVLMLGCGVLMMEIGVAAMPTGTARSTGTGFAIYNASVLLSALCHFTGVAITFRRRTWLRRSAAWLTAAYAGGTAAMGLVIWLALTDRMPVFFIDGEGGTLLRSLVVSAGVALFVLTAGLLWQTNRRAPSPFLYLYALGLVLLATGLAGSMLIEVKDSPLQWVTRSTQFFGLVYMCMAILFSARESSAQGIPLAAVEDTWRGSAWLAGLRRQTPLGWVLRHGLAFVAVAAAIASRRAAEAWVGPGLPTFVTFYPAVTVVALLGGFGPGLLATALAGIVASYWILPPVGQFGVALPVDRLGLVIFSGMGLFISVLSELYHRSRNKAAAYDREQALRETRREKEFLANLLEHASQPFAVGYPDGRVGRFNHAFQQLTGYTAAELRTLDWSAVLTPLEWREMEKEKLDELQRTGQPVRYEKEYVRKDGSRVPIELLVHLARDAEGNPEYYYSFLTDITERRRAEQAERATAEHLRRFNTELQAANASLQESRATAVSLMDDAIAARQRVEQAAAELRQKEAELREAQRVAHIGNWHWDAQTDATTGSDELLRIYGLDPATGTMPAFKDQRGRLYPPEDWERVKAVVERTMQTGAGYELDVRALRNGAPIWITTRSEVVRDAGGRIVGVRGTVQDITERKRAEEALRESESRYRNVFETMTEGFSIDEIICDASGKPRDLRFLEVNPAFERHTGLKAPDILGRTVLELFPEAEPLWIEHYGKVSLTGEPAQFEAWFGPLGRCFEVRSYRIGPGRVAVVFNDITERKQAEERIRHHNAVLEGLNRILQEALAIDTEEELGRRCLAVAEKVTESTFGFIAEINAEGRLDTIAMSDPGLKAGWIHGIDGRLFRDGKGFYTNDPASHPDSIGTPEGYPPLQAFLGVPLKHDGKTIGMMAMGNREGGYRPQDLECLEALAAAVVQVFMRKRAEQAVRAGEERLRQAQKMESIGVLAGGIAHDFNNLLTGILGNASLLQIDAENSRQLEAIVESSEKAAALTRQLLAYAGKGKEQITDVDVSRLVRSSAELIRVSIPRNVEVRLDVPRNLPTVRGDASQIQQVVMNLVINAAEAIEGRQDGRVSVSAGILDLDRDSAGRVGTGIAPGRYVSIAVRDNGCGMDVPTRARIFEPFFTTKFTGRGLGLAAVHGILGSHKGTIAVESSPGQGSTFTVYLPCGGHHAATTGRGNATAAGQRGATVLIVDDEELVRDVTKAALERLGHKVLLAVDGRQALDLLSSHGGVDLVVLDIVMPVLGGLEAFVEMRKKWPKLAVLVATGYSLQEAQRLGMPGGLPFLEKPYTMQTLAAAVEKALGARPQ